MTHDVVSDLHFDNGMNGGPFGWFGNIDISRWVNDGARILLVAGDTANQGDDAIDFFNAAANYYEHVVAIFGNHEVVGSKTPVANVHLLEDGPIILGGIAFVGGQYCKVADSDVFSIKAVEQDASVNRLIILSHFAPDVRCGEALGIDMRGKANDLISRLGTPEKSTTIVFGHAHIPFSGIIDGYQCLSNPRGYRGLRRDRSAFRRFAQLD